jgi:hypothetical protein
MAHEVDGEREPSELSALMCPVKAAVKVLLLKFSPTRRVALAV